MCGIAGIISKKASLPELGRILGQQHHRGPDDTGTFLDPGFAALGHNRLAILHLSHEANQPFCDPEKRYYLSFNGEIYNYLELKKELTPNYRFTTTSDTEVLLAAYIHWGSACLEKFVGMFSFAIWDSREKSLFIARDRFGVKPLYYSLEGRELYFSSEIKALRGSLRRDQPNQKVWANYFSFGSYGMPDETFFDNISQLPGGHYLEFKAGHLTITQWYDFPSQVNKIAPLSFDAVKEAYLDLLKNSILLRFRADVPVGFNISGGVDSSLLLALINRTRDHKQIQAYTFYTGDSRYDELSWVEKMIATTENPLRKVKLTAAEVPSIAREIARAQDEPFGGIPSLAYSKIFEQAKRDGVKVLLDGQGMDEQWAGYDYYQTGSEGSIQGLGTRSAFRPNVLSREFASLAEKPSFPTPFDNELQNLQYRDLFYTKIPRALRFNDRISMLHSTELREPFLDHRLVEYAMAQPYEYKIHQKTGKHLVRELLKTMAPRELTYAPKRPLQTPQREWLGEDLREFVESQLKSLKNSSVSDWFDLQEMEREWQAYLKGDRQSSFHIWQWVNLSLLQ